MKLGLKFGFKMLLRNPVRVAASLLAFVCFVLFVWRLCVYVRDRRLCAALQAQEAPIGQENIP